MSVFDRFSEEELLALLEGELDAVAALELEERLADVPGALAVLERMRSDRVLLQGVLPPDMPMDFLAAIEPQLARPMLMEHQPPGAYRRRHRRQRRGRNIRRAAVAAAVLLFVGGGIWTVLSSWPASPPEHLATNDVEEPGAGVVPETRFVAPAPTPREVVATSGAAPLEGTIHHRLPIAAGDDALAHSTGESGEPGASITAVGFALVLEATDVQTAEAAVDSTLASIDGPSLAFVRHFNEAELQMILNDAAVARSRNRHLIDMRAAMEGSEGVSSHDFSPARWNALQEPMRRLRRADSDAGGDVLIGRQLRGAKALSPDYAEQLDLSRRGVSHTVTVPVGDLQRLLAALRKQDDTASRLTLLRSEEAGEEATEETTEETTDVADLQRWVTDLRTMKRMLADIRAEHGEGAAVQLPVIVRVGR